MAARGQDGVDGIDGIDATMVVAGQSCDPPYRIVGFDAEGIIVCDTPVDADRDTHGVDQWGTETNGYVNDCDDTDSSVYPGANEVPDDGIDQDCDGSDLVIDCDDSDPYTEDSVSDSGCNHTPSSADVDYDGSPADMSVGGSPDCDDTNSNINPTAYDEPGDSIDQDCDGIDAMVE